jgi:hypothetical protein
MKMKRVLVAAMLLLGSVSVFAEGREVKKDIKAAQDEREEDKLCTVSISAKLSYPLIAEASFICSASAEDCITASEMAQGCVQYNIEKFRKKIEGLWRKLMDLFD